MSRKGGGRRHSHSSSVACSKLLRRYLVGVIPGLAVVKSEGAVVPARTRQYFVLGTYGIPTTPVAAKRTAQPPVMATELHDADELPAFSIGMVEVISNAANMHTQNDLKQPWQRQTVMERNNGRVSVSCVTKDIVHGFFAEGADGVEEEDGREEPQHCSLIVLHFRFDALDLGRRIKRVEATVRFSAIDRDNDDPIVHKVSPDGFFWVYPTTQRETVTSGVSGKVGGAVLGAELSAELKREWAVEKEATHASMARGASHTLGRNYGKPNAATWTLKENDEDKTGVPTSLRASILVLRDDARVNFQAHFSMSVTPDNLTQAQTWFKSDPKDDPVLYKVDRRPTNRLHNYYDETIDAENALRLINNLGRLDLEGREFADITFCTVWQDAQKTR